ncbi:MAG: TonB dependent Vitamin outer rane receptor [Proteobacteria bacterium]|nr:TonB dependent Vitamin outer rane receptor [Pseudomonadota bacterium]
MTKSVFRKSFINNKMRNHRLRCVASFAVFAAVLPWQDALADEAAAHDLGMVVFSANRTPTEEAAVGSAVTTITRKEIDRSGETTVQGLLARIPGLGFSQAGPVGSTTSMQMRGLGARYVLVRVDGIDVSDPTQPQAGPNLENLLLGNVERIEVLRGSQSALYGGTAVAGVIDITTRTADEKGIHHTASVGGGSYGTGVARYGLSAATDAFEMAASFQRFQTSGFSSAASDNGNTETDGYGNSTASATASYRVNEALRLFAAARYTRHDSKYDDFSYDGATGLGSPVDETGPTRFHTIGREFGARVGADFSLLDGRLKSTFAIQHYDLGRDVYDSSPGEYDGQRTKVEYLGNLAVTEAIGLSFGLDSTFEGAETTGGVDNDMSNTGVFAQGSWKPVTDVTLTAALRDDHHSTWGDHPTGRLTAAWEATQSTKLRTSWGTGFRPPSLYELYAPFYGNSNLKPEESRSFDVGIDQQVWDNRGRLSLTYFNIDTDNLISYDTSTWAYTQVEGTSNSQGIELSGRLKVLDNLTLDAGYTLTEAVDASDSRLLRVPRHKITAGATLKADERTTLTLRGTWVGDSVDTDYSVGTVRQLPDYFLLDAGLTWDLSDTVSISLTGKNLLDENYQTIWGYGTAGRTIYAELTAHY